MQPVIDHIQITVADLEVAEKFYDKLMPILGFDLANKSKGRVEAHDFDVIEYAHPVLIVGINSPRDALRGDRIHRRRPGSLHHLAFRADSCQQVDELYMQIRDIGATIVEEPQFFPQHGQKYYAMYFKDAEGLKYEIVYEERSAMHELRK